MPRQLVGRGVSTIRYDPERRALHRRLVRLRLDPGFDRRGTFLKQPGIREMLFHRPVTIARVMAPTAEPFS